jgi:hypothetical protein
MKANFAIAIVIVLYAQMGLATSSELQNESSGPQAEELATGLQQDTYNGSLELNGVQRLPGKLPPDMPVDLPIPDGARIVESEIQEDSVIFVILDVPMKPDLTLDFYRQHLASQNWREIPGMNRGFIEQGVFSVNFCQGPNNSSLIVTATPQENGTDLCISVMSDTDYSFCSQGPSFLDDWLMPIPMLTGPNGTRMPYAESMGSPDSMQAVSATLETEMNSSSLADHYADQLKAANWTMIGEGESGPSSWSSWSIEDEDGRAWDGFLMALELAGTDEKQRFVLMQATYNYSLELDGVQTLQENLSQDMPLDLPIPDGARVVANEIEEETGILVILDVPMTPDLTLDFYRERLASQNWTEIEIPGTNQGFVEQGVFNTEFCQGLKNSSMALTATPQENGTYLSMSIMSDSDYSFCSQDPSFFGDWLNPIPMLTIPNGTMMFNPNSMSGPNSTQAVSVTLETEMNSSSLTAHYADQLKAANWTMMSEGESGPSSWSIWSIEDENGRAWQGFLVALELPGTDGKQKFVLMQANMLENYFLNV